MIIPIITVTIAGANPRIQRDINACNEVWVGEAGVFIINDANLVVNRPNLLILTQTDCRGSGHVVSAEEDELFDLGRGLGAEVVGYYIQSDVAGFLGCAAHPFGRRGFWVADSARAFDYTFAHELGHVVGDISHIIDTDNLMHPFANEMTNPPPDFNSTQVDQILRDPALLDIGSIVCNL